MLRRRPPRECWVERGTSRRRQIPALALIPLTLAVAACSGPAGDSGASGSPGESGPAATVAAEPSPAATAPAPDGAPPSVDLPVSAEIVDVIDRMVDDPLAAPSEVDLAALGASGDLRLGWVLADQLRFILTGVDKDAMVSTLVDLTDQTVGEGEVPWVWYSDLLLAWQVPAPPGYFEFKRSLFLAFEAQAGFEPSWAPFFDPDASLDWREVSFGGVGRDQIPQLDDPEVVTTDEGDWLPDGDIVFGVVVDGESRAYPRRVMEVHEMVNDTVGGRRITLPYCTLCGAAIAYYTDAAAGVAPAADPLEFRTSGLLQRSNKLMYEAGTESLFDQFTGVALSGPLADDEVVLPGVAVVTTTWGRWRAEYPDTTVVSEDAGIGRVYVADPLGGRDDAGPIFPIGAVDDRLGVQEMVLGVVAPSGEPVAFPVAAAQQAIADGSRVELGGVEVQESAGGLVAVDDQGDVLAGHEAFWFAWSQFWPETLLWAG